MTQVLTDNGAKQILNKFFKNDAPVDPKLLLGLYTNNPALSDATLLSDLTAAVGGNYAPIDILTTDWTVDVIGGIAQVTAAAKTFTFNGGLAGGLAVNGYYIYDMANVLILVESIESFTPSTTGDSISVTATFQLGKGTIQ